jgi:hypothetical protein
MKPSSRPRKTATHFSGIVQETINTYALAAGAAGVSLLALAQPSEAEIVYTPANQTIGHNGSLKLDLNHDGITDFVISEQGLPWGSNGTSQNLNVKPALNNQVNCRYQYCASTEGAYAAALAPGVEIGPQQSLHGWNGGVKEMAAEILDRGIANYFGSWRYARGGYLGLQFHINGETHFGWARLTVTFQSGIPEGRTWIAHLTGYAYETVPNKAIEAGQTTENAGDAAAQPHLLRPAVVRPGAARHARPTSLGALALGAEGVALWRRDDSQSDREA